MTDRKPERRGLGRGLSALMADVAPVRADGAPRRADLVAPIELVEPNPDQPRRDFPVGALDELAASIREKGIIQPIVVRNSPATAGRYQIIAGERRWRAAQIAQLHEVPIVIRDVSDAELLELAIIENIQRADLNPVEEAQGYRQLMDRFGHTQEKLAEALSKSRSYIANLLRLLSLPPQVIDWLREGRLTAGHARALITAADPVGLAREVLEKGLSVREAERLAQAGKVRKSPPTQRQSPEKDADTRVLEQDLSANLGMPVVIDHKGHDGGHVTIRYKTLEQLDELCQLLSQVR